MRVLLVAYDNPFEGLTGVATYGRDLADALAGAGHEVSHLYIGDRSWSGQPGLRWSSHQGRTTVSVTNSPLLRQFSVEQPLQDATHPVLEALLTDACLRLCPDLVHMHDLSGIPASFVRACRRHGLPVVITLHDFWPFCQQLLLVRPGLVPCQGSEGGRNCALYCSVRATGVRRFLRYWELTAPSPAVRTLLRQSVRLYHTLRGHTRSQFALPLSQPVRKQPDPHVAQAYSMRESLMREGLLQADLLLAVSRFAKSMYVRHGYPPERIRVMPLSTKSGELVRWRLRTFRGYPVRFAYLGRVNPWKGAHVLAEAAASIAPELAQFTFYGAIEEEDCRFLRALAGDHPGLHFRGRYTHAQLPAILDEIDVLVFPSVMRETLGLVGLEAQAAGLPIIGADHGAIPEYVHHEVNGLLFSAGSALSLRVQILRIVQEPGLIAHLSRNVHPQKRMEEHAREVLQVYEETLGLVRATVGPR